MDIRNGNDISNLMMVQKDNLITIYMPTHKAGKETRQNPIRFQNLLRELEDRLLTLGNDDKFVAKVKKTLEKSISEGIGWQNMMSGLAIFTGGEHSNVIQLPQACPELVYIGNHYYIRPLVPFLTNKLDYYVLTLSLNQNKLYEIQGESITEIEIPDAPKSLDDVLEGEVYHEGHQFHSGTPSGAAPDRAAMYHSHADEEDRGEQISRYLRALDTAVSKVLMKKKSPLVLYAVDYLAADYARLSNYDHILADVISGNPDHKKSHEILEESRPVLEPILANKRAKAIAEFKKLHGTNQASGKLDEIWMASLQKKIKVLFLNKDATQWGQPEAQNGALHLLASRKPGSVEILDRIVVNVHLAGGEIIPLPPEELPASGMVNAIYRY